MKSSKKIAGVSALAEMKEEIENLIFYLEDAYRQSAISEKSYKELKSANLKRLEEIKFKLGRSDGRGK